MANVQRFTCGCTSTKCSCIDEHVCKIARALGKHRADCKWCNRAPRKTPWTARRLEAVINAVTSMLSGEDGEGDWHPNHKREDLEAGLARLQEDLEAIEKRRS